MKIKSIFAFATLVVGVSVSPLATAQSYTITDLGLGKAVALNDTGTVVLSSGSLWSNGSFVSMAQNFNAKDINNSGVVAGTMAIPGADRAYTWSNGTFSPLPFVPGNSRFGYSQAVGINNNGQTVGSMVMPDYVGGGVWRATIWQSGEISSGLQWQTLAGNYPDAQWANSMGYAINDLGQVVGTSQSNLGDLIPFIYTNGKIKELSATNGFNFVGATPTDINNLGAVVGRSASDTGFLLRADGTITTLNDLVSQLSVNDSNFIVGSTGGHAFLFDGLSMINLSELAEVRAEGWDTLDFANDINNSGQIVGYGRLGGVEHAFLLTPIAPIPEPETYAMMLAGLGLLGLSRRRNQNAPGSDETA